MAMLDVHERLRAAAYSVPKPWFAFGLSAGLWMVIFAMGAESLQLLHRLQP